MTSRPLLLKIFLAALMVRWAYAIVLYLAMGKAGLMGTDSIGFFGIAEDFVAELKTGQFGVWALLSPHHQLMPIYAWLLNVSILTGGSAGALVYVLMQGAIDAGTCVLIYALANEFSPRFALPAAIAAIVNPTQVVMSGLIYPDIPFVFFVTLFLLASVRFIRHPSWPLALTIGIGFGCASLCRILIGPWVPVHLLFLVLALVILRRFAWRHLAQLAAAGVIFCAFLAPVMIRNVVHYGSWSLTAQGGTHLAIWVVPLVKEAADGTPWIKTAEDMQKRLLDRYGVPPVNPFEASRQQAEFGREVLWSLGLPAIAKAWINGAAINLASPAIALVPAVAQLPRTGFYDTKGASLPEKIFNFLFRSDNALYAKLILVGIAGVVSIRLLQLYGFWIAYRTTETKTGLILLLLWACYILAISGPIASPKYRLPIEPFFMVLTGAGIAGRRRFFGRIDA